MRKLELAEYKAICHIIAVHDSNLKRFNDKIDDIAGLKNRADVFIQGGKNESSQEKATRSYEKFLKLPIGQMVQAVEKGFVYLRKKFENEEQYAERLIKAIVENCKHPRDSNYIYCNEYYKLWIAERTFYKYKRLLAEFVAVFLGYIDDLELAGIIEDPIDKDIRQITVND
jgi:hypothetical protein